ncbi:hypothetical protein OEZ86_000086 [Tetradesmus obliquus]|nr:hypothetical protein OEZ86_000086 [Tetradesmus obliquus]
MSDFSAKIHEKRHQLTTQLVAKLLGLQPEDENFSLAHDFCLQKEYYHSFGDVNPSAVEADYAELAQRLQEDSQPSKAAALSALTCSLLGSDLAADDTPELNHKLLQLLASLAGQPLDSTLEETPQLLQLLYQPAEQQQQQQQQQPRQQRQQQQVTAVSRFRQLLWGGKAAAADALLEQALLAPIQERLELVGSRLLGSLMGEWGLLHQLQGLVAVSLLASPTMVEWCEAAFAAAEAALEAKRQHNKKARPGSPGKDRAAAAGARLAAGGGVGGGPSVVLGADELDVVELELLLQDLVSAADCPENPLPDPACLHLSINVAALADLRTAKQKQLQEGGSQAAIGDAAAAATAAAAAVGAASAAATGGLWGCAGEWAGLSCRHSGSWQLSLLYNPEELARFSTAWRFLVQLRWVRRRLDAARHGACKGTAARHGACKGAAARRGASKGAAARHDAAGQDAREEAAVAAAMRAAAASRGLAHSRAAEPGSGGSAAPKWLSGRQELLLLQEMGQMMGRWQQYIMDRLLCAALPALLQALCSAGSLDEVRSAAGAFLATVCNLCNARPSGKGAGGTWQHIGRVLARLMDRCLAAAAAAARLQELRQMLGQPGLEPAEAQRSWLELCGLRARLAAVSGDWRGDVGYLLRILKMRSTTLGDADDLEALLGCLDANGYWQRLAGHQLAAAR